MFYSLTNDFSIIDGKKLKPEFVKTSVDGIEKCTEEDA